MNVDNTIKRYIRYLTRLNGNISAKNTMKDKVMSLLLFTFRKFKVRDGIEVQSHLITQVAHFVQLKLENQF